LGVWFEIFFTFVFVFFCFRVAVASSGLLRARHGNTAMDGAKARDPASRSRLKEKIKAMEESRKPGGGGAGAGAGLHRAAAAPAPPSIEKVLADVPAQVQRLRAQIQSGAKTVPDDAELSAADVERILAKAGADPRFAPRVIAALERVQAGEASLEDAVKTAADECLTIAQMAR
jgi:hypothetical protein